MLTIYRETLSLAVKNYHINYSFKLCTRKPLIFLFALASQLSVDYSYLNTRIVYSIHSRLWRALPLRVTHKNHKHLIFYKHKYFAQTQIMNNKSISLFFKEFLIFYYLILNYLFVKAIFDCVRIIVARDSWFALQRRYQMKGKAADTRKIIYFKGTH